MRLGASDRIPELLTYLLLLLWLSLFEEEGEEEGEAFSWPPMSATESMRANTFSAAAADLVKLVMRPCRDWYAEFIMFQ